jgi:hypothetical protein
LILNDDVMQDQKNERASGPSPHAIVREALSASLLFSEVDLVSGIPACASCPSCPVEIIYYGGNNIQ